MSIPTNTHLVLGRCLVVGGCGFLGRHIVQELLKDKSCNFIAVASRTPFEARAEGVSYFVCDISNVEEVKLLMAHVAPNVIFNTSSPIAYMDWEHAADYFHVNGLFPQS